MTSRERIINLFNNKTSDRTGYWSGNPHADTFDMYLSTLKLNTREEFFSYMKDDCRWFFADVAYKHPEGKPMWNPIPELCSAFDCTSMAAVPGRFADCTDVSEIHNHDWPNPDYLDFTELIADIRSHSDDAVFTGMWTCFFHVVADYFGMENYFIKMYTDPDIVDAVTGHVVDFYLEANDRFFKALGNDADIYFFGNDFGTQLELIISPDSFKRYVLPGFKKNIDLAKSYGKKVLLHSCGAIHEVIPILIDAGIDGLHPLQAKAKGMDAESLAKDFKDKIVFVGGVDTQDLLMHATPSQIKDEVRRLKSILGPRYIVSPSHEAILPNVPLDNVIAMSEAAREV